MIHDNQDAALQAQERMAERFGDRLLFHLGRMQAAFNATGFQAKDPKAIIERDDGWEWWFNVSEVKQEFPRMMAISYELIRGCHYDGLPWGDLVDTDDHPLGIYDDGVNLALKGIGDGGVIVIDCQPWNYTPKVWVGCENWLELEHRFRLLTSDDAHAMVMEEARKYLTGVEA